MVEFVYALNQKSILWLLWYNCQPNTAFSQRLLVFKATERWNTLLTVFESRCYRSVANRATSLATEAPRHSQRSWWWNQTVHKSRWLFDLSTGQAHDILLKVLNSGRVCFFLLLNTEKGTWYMQKISLKQQLVPTVVTVIGEFPAQSTNSWENFTSGKLS